MDLAEVFGTRAAALIGAATILYFSLTYFPALWPLVRARFLHPRLPRPWLFAFVVAGLVYGWFVMLLATLALPGQVFLVYIAPQLQEAGKPYGRWFVPALAFFVEYWWLLMPPLLLILTWLVTRMLARRWAAICSRMAT